jgi:tRNA G26 N,N-dimethylase Trm1
LSIQPLGVVTTDDKTNNKKYSIPKKSPPVNEKCKYCQHSHRMGGPFWIDPIHDLSFVKRLRGSIQDVDSYGTLARMDGM